MANTYDVVDLVRASATFADADGNAIDPGTVTLKVKAPAGTVTTLVYVTDVALVRDSQGAYHADINVTAAGSWWFRWEASGTGQSAGESWFNVRTSRF
jgi:hypothetical protein